MTSILEVHFTWKTSKGKTIEDAREHEVPVAGTGTGSPSEAIRSCSMRSPARSSRSFGYPGSTQGMLAAERGEVDGGLTSWNTLKRTSRVGSRQGRQSAGAICQCAASGITGCAHLVGACPHAGGRQVLAFYVSGAELGRSLLAPPGIPAERVKVLRAALTP